MQMDSAFYNRPQFRHWSLLYIGCLFASSLWLAWYHLAGAPPPISLAIGIATAGLLLGGIRSWPAVALGLFSAILLVGPSRPLIVEIPASGALLLGGVITAWVVKRSGVGESELLEPRAVLWALGAAAAGALVAALIGTLTAAATAPIPLPREFLDRALRLGLGMFIATPLVLVWATRPRQRWRPIEWIGFLLSTGLTAAITASIFLSRETGPIAWLAYPPLMLSALVFHLRGAATAMAIMAVIILWGTQHLRGPFAAAHESGIVLAQAYIVLMGGSTLLLAAFADKRKLHEERRVAEQRYRAVFEQRGVAVSLLSLDGVYLDMNARGLEICGYSHDEIVGAHFSLLEPEAVERIRTATAEVIARTRPTHSEDRPIVTKTGGQRILNITTNVVRRPDGQPDHLLTVAKDITERVLAQEALSESEKRLRLAQDAAGVGVWEIAFDGTMHHSPESAALFGLAWHAGEYALDDLGVLLGTVQVAALREAVDAAARENGTLELTLKLTDTEGGDRWVRLYGSQAPHHGQPRLLGLAIDVTHDFEAEAKLVEAHDRLLRVARLSAMGAMASTLAHELNQPLAALTNYIEMCRYLERRRKDPDPAEAEALEMASAQALRAGGIIRKIRAFTQTGDIEVERLDLGAVIRSACASVQPLKLAKGVRIDCQLDPDPAPLLGDALQIEQVVANLLRNAIEATMDCAERRVTVSTHVEEHSTIVQVADNGPGLGQAMIDNLFEPFRTTKESGTGLGLSICRAIVDAHGGKLWAENGPAGGARFRFTIPHVATDAEAGLEEAS